MPGAVIEDGAVVQYAIVAENTVIGKNAVVGEKPEDVSDRDKWGITVIGANAKIGENCVVKAKQMIQSDTEVKADEK